MRNIYAFLLSFLLTGNLGAQTIKILFDASKAETAGNADWVIDEDLNNLGWKPNAVVGAGNEGNAQRIPTPSQSVIVSSTLENYWKGALSAWGVDCVKRGYTVESLAYDGAITFGNTTNPYDLSNYKVFVLCEPNILFTAADKTAIINFVFSGGSLFMVSDHANSDRNNDGKDSPQILNDLMKNNSVMNNPFGMLFDSLSISPNTTNIPNLPNDSLLHGPMGAVTQAMWASGTTITLNPALNASVKGVVYIPGSSFGNTGVMAAYARFGKGKVVAIGDSSPCDDGTGDTGDQLYNGWTTDASGNHERLIMNATIWLAIKDSIIAPSPPQLRRDLKIKNIMKPQALSKGLDSVSIVIENSGEATIDTATVAYRLNSSSIISLTLSAMHLAKDSSYNYAFATPLNILNDGNYILCTWVKTWGDTNAINDTLCNSYVVMSTAVADPIIQDESIALYPNPAHEQQLTVSSGSNKIVSVQITDLSGKEVMKISGDESQTLSIETGLLKPGLYFVHVQLPGVVVVKKWVRN